MATGKVLSKCSLQVVRHLAVGLQSPNPNLDCPPTDRHLGLTGAAVCRALSVNTVLGSRQSVEPSVARECRNGNVSFVSFVWLSQTLRRWRVLYRELCLPLLGARSLCQHMRLGL